MELTYTGLVLIVLGGLLSIFFKNWFYSLTVFFVPFTATAVINFSSGFWLTPFQLFGCLWILSEISKWMLMGKIKLFPHRGLAIWLVLIFAGVVSISIIMPLIIDGQILIQSPSLIETGSSPLYFTATNFTRALYVVFGSFIAIFVAIKNSHAPQLALTLKIYVLSGFFVSLWGWLQLIFYVLNIPYPDFIFNNSLNTVAQGFTQTIYELASLETTRISSVAVEPSIFTQYLFSVIPIVLYAVLKKQPITSRYMDQFILMTMIGILILSTSSSAYVGMLVLGAEVLGVLLLMGRLSWKHVLSFMLILITPLILYFSVPFVREFMDVFLFSKMAAGSGLERLLTIEYAWGYFQEYPILGLGWGSITSHDLIVNLLANSGILGFASFLCMVVYVLGRLIRVVLTLNVKYAVTTETTLMETWGVGITLSISTLLIMQIMTGFTYGFGHFWFILGVAMATHSVIRSKSRSVKGSKSFKNKCLPSNLQVMEHEA